MAGKNGTSGGYNSFFGKSAGYYCMGSQNSFFGAKAGQGYSGLLTGSYNSFFGMQAGYNTTSGFNNAFFGHRAGFANTTGYSNCFFGRSAGSNVTTGDRNIIIGDSIDAPSATANEQLSIGNLIFGTGLDGSGAVVSSGNIGIGEPAPAAKLHIVSGGAIRLGNAAVASGALANTHTLTIEDSTGTVYRLLCLV
jgi:hypothetical protein